MMASSRSGSPVRIVDSTRGLFEVVDTDAAQRVLSLSQRRGRDGRDPDLRQSALEYLNDNSNRHGMLWLVACQSRLTDERRVQFVEAILQQQGVNANARDHLVPHIVTLLDHAEAASRETVEQTPDFQRAILRRSNSQRPRPVTIHGLHSGILSQATAQGQYCVVIESPDGTKLFPDFLSFLLAVTHDPRSLHNAIKEIANAQTNVLETLLAFNVLSTGLNHVLGLSLTNRENPARFRVGSDGSLEAKSRGTRIFILVTLSATITLVLILFYYTPSGAGEGKDIGEAGFVAALTLLASVIFSALSSAGDQSSWVRLLVQPYIPVGNGVGYFGTQSKEDVVKICFDDGQNPYRENFCWTGQSKSDGVLPCAGLPIRRIDPQYGCGSVVVAATNGVPLGAYRKSNEGNWCLRQSQSYVVHVPMDKETVFGSSHSNLAPYYNDNSNCILEKSTEQTLAALSLFLVATTTTAITVLGGLNMTVLGNIKIVAIDPTAMESKGNGAAQAFAKRDVIQRGSIEYALLEQCCLGDPNQDRLGRFESTILISKLDTDAKSPNTFQVPPYFVNGRVLILVCCDVDPTVRSILHLCKWKGVILMYNPKTHTTTPLTTTALERERSCPEMPERVWSLCSVWTSFIFALTEVETCRMLVVPLVVLSVIFAHRQPAREALIFSEKATENIYVAAAAGLHVPRLADAALQGALSFTIIVAWLFADASFFSDAIDPVTLPYSTMVGACPIAALGLYHLLGMVNVVKRDNIVPFFLCVISVPLAVTGSFIWIAFRDHSIVAYCLGCVVAVGLVVGAASQGFSSSRPINITAGMIFLCVCLLFAGSGLHLYSGDWPFGKDKLRGVKSFTRWGLSAYLTSASTEAWCIRTLVAGFTCGFVSFIAFQKIEDFESEKKANDYGTVRNGILRRKAELEEQNCCHMEETRLLTPLLPVVDGKQSGLTVHRRAGPVTPLKDGTPGPNDTGLFR